MFDVKWILHERFTERIKLQKSLLRLHQLHLFKKNLRKVKTTENEFFIFMDNLGLV